MHHFKAKHFPALDGLRGLAILLVIIHHQLIPLSLKGGFLGVDLFFVLSGFLITTLLLMEFDATETISLKNFYARRALRLGPALLLYLAFSLAVTYRLHPNEFVSEIKLVGLSLVYLTNWRMALGWNLSLDPTAIIWSLSIEEQFYLLWPMAFFLCLVCRVKLSQIATGLGLIIVGVLVHRYWLLVHGADFQRLYYGTDTRADAPLLGCLVALLPSVKFAKTSKRLLQLASFTAAGSYLYLVLTAEFTDKFLYRGGYTLVALLAGVLTWSAANNSLGFLSPVLELQPLRWLGKISYGLYLWHWLLLRSTSFYYWFGATDPWVRLIVALGVASISYYAIETPFTRLKSKFSYAPLVSGPDRDQRTKTQVIGPPLGSTFSNPVLIQPSTVSE